MTSRFETFGFAPIKRAGLGAEFGVGVGAYRRSDLLIFVIARSRVAPVEPLGNRKLEDLTRTRGT